MNPEIQDILDTGSASQVRALFEFDKNTQPAEILKKFFIWSRYFFPRYFSSPDAPHHREGDMRRVRIYAGLDPVFLNIAYRGDAKTTRAKLFRAFAICNDTGHYRRYMRVLSKDPDNAKQTITDIYNMLISARVKALYPEIFEKTEAKREERMGGFTTSTGVKMIAESIGVDQRGAVQEDARPDFDLYDDFETRISLYSATITYKIWQNMEEAKTGLAKGGTSEYTCNYISERGNVHKLVLRTEQRYKMIVPIGHKKSGKWIPTWKRYTHDEIAYMEKHEDEFDGERLCKPSASKDVYFAREAVDKQTQWDIVNGVRQQVYKEPLDEINSLKFWKKFNPVNRTVSGSDVGGGVGLDSSTNVVIDLDCIPAQVIATYKNNEVKPDAHAHVLAAQNKKYFGACYTAIEKNFGSTNDIFKTLYPTAAIHRTQRSENKIVTAKSIEYGWETNGSTKGQMLADLGQGVEDGLIDLNDPDLIAEARSYTTADLMDNEVDPRLTTRHFDLLMACAIAWHVRNFVKKPTAQERRSMPGAGAINTPPRKNPAR